MKTTLMKLEDGSLQFTVQNEPILNVKFDEEVSEKTNANWYLISFGSDYQKHFNFEENCLNGIYSVLKLADNYFPKNHLTRIQAYLDIILNDFHLLRVS